MICSCKKSRVTISWSSMFPEPSNPISQSIWTVILSAPTLHCLCKFMTLLWTSQKLYIKKTVSS